MEQDSKKYQGTIPRPSKEQIEGADIADFEKEELSDQKYRDEGLPPTVAEIVADPEKYEKVLSDPQFKQLLEAASIKVEMPAKKEEKKEEESKPAEKEPDTKKEGANSGLEVAATPVVPEDSIDPKDIAQPEAPAEKKVTMFDPTLICDVRSISSKVTVKVTCGFVQLSDHGLSEMLNSPFPIDSNWGRTFREIAMKYQRGGLIKCMTHTDATADVSLHAFVVDDMLSPIAGKVHEMSLSDRRIGSHTMTAQDDINHQRLIRRTLLPTELTEIGGVDEADAVPMVLDLAFVPRTVGTRVTYQDVIMNPEYVQFLLHGRNFYKETHLPFDEWVNAHINAGILNPRCVQYILERRNFLEREMITSSKHSQALYQVKFFGRSDDFYFTEVPDEPHDIAHGPLNRSHALAVEAVEHISSAERKSRPVDRMGADWMGKMALVTPEDGSRLGRDLAAGLLGGYRRAFIVEPVPDGTPLLVESMCAYATLLGMDFDALDVGSQTMLLSSCLKPFYNQCGNNVLVGRKGGAMAPKYVKGYDEFIATYLQDRQQTPGTLFVLTDPPPLYSNTSMTGLRAGPNIANIIAQEINFALQRKFYVKQIENRIFNSRGRNLMFPFAPRGDVFDLVNHGEPGVNEPPRYATSAHAAESEIIARSLENWSLALSQMEGGRGLSSAIKACFVGQPQMKNAMALMTTALAIGSQERELLPFDTGTRMAGVPGIPVPVMADPIDYVVLPFRGFMGFFMHGIASAKVETNMHYLRYTDLVSPKMPSMYPMYIAAERCIVYDVIMLLKVRDPALLDVRRDEMVELILFIISKFFRVDPESKERIYSLLSHSDNTQTLPGFPNVPSGANAVPPLILPRYYRMLGVTDFRRAGNVPPLYNGDVSQINPQAGLAKGAIFSPMNQEPDNPALGYDLNNGVLTMFDSMPKGPVLALDDAKHGLVRTFYITRLPITPIRAMQYENSTAFIYTDEEPVAAQDIIDLEDLLRHRPDSRTEWTETELQQMANVYVRDLRRTTEWTAIKVKSVYTTFTLVEDTGTTDQLKQNTIRVAVKRDKERHRMDKFTVTNLPVYVHRTGDRTQQRGLSIAEENRIMRSLFTFVLVPLNTIRKTLVHFDGVNLDDVQLYTHEQRGMGQEYLDRAEISRLVLRDGYHGATIAGRFRLSTRTEEKYTLMDKLEKRTLRGTI